MAREDAVSWSLGVSWLGEAWRLGSRKQGSSARMQLGLVVLVVTSVNIVPPRVGGSTGSCGCCCGGDVWWDMVLLLGHWSAMIGSGEGSMV